MIDLGRLVADIFVAAARYLAPGSVDCDGSEALISFVQSA
jgi:hypothetical protein